MSLSGANADRHQSTGSLAESDQFEIVRQIGEGGMGLVYEALDKSTGERLALKTLRHLDATALLRFKREFRALQGLEHPNLVRLGELFEDRGTWYFTMELVHGVDFVSFIRGRSTELLGDQTTLRGFTDTGPAPVLTTAAEFDEARLRDCLRQLVAALQTIHDGNHVHRDVKPSNIRVTREGRVVVLDFGLITEIEGTRSAHDNVVGTANYMAPEQAASRQVTPAADWYSVGVILYEILTGQPPFVGTPLQVLMNKQIEEPPDPAKAVPSCAGDLTDLCARLLRFDPAKRPTGQQLVNWLGSAVAPASDTRTSEFSGTSSIIGRKRELELIRKAFEQTRTGDATAVIVEGESGIGKSALASYFVHEVRLQDEGAAILRGRCYERESVPYKAFDGVIDALANYLGLLEQSEAQLYAPRNAALLPRVFPVLGTVEAIAHAPRSARQPRDPLELRSRAFDALRELLGRLAERRPTVVAIDDMQWADPDSVALLNHLLRPPDQPMWFLLLTTRPTNGDRPATATIGKALPIPVAPIDLSSLSMEDALGLVRSLIKKRKLTDDIDAEAIATEARGHPLYIDELLRHIADGRSSKGQIPRLDEAIWQRIQQLPAPARRLLEFVAVAGLPLPRETIRQAADIPLPAFRRQIATLRVASMVRAERENVVEPYHDRVREAVQRNLTSEQTVACHRRLAISLELLPNPDPEVLARQHERAGSPERAAEFYVAAARNAQQTLAFERSARLYNKALQIGTYDQTRRRELRTSLGDTLSSAGRGPDAAAAYLSALPGANTANTISLRRSAAFQLLSSGHIDAGVDAIREALALVHMDLSRTPGQAAMRFLGHRLALRLRGMGYRLTDESEIEPRTLMRIDVVQSAAEGLGMVDPIRGAEFQSKLLRLALKAGEPKRIARAYANEAAYSSATGAAATRKAERALARLEEVVARLDDVESEALLLATRGVVCFQTGRPSEGYELLKKAELLFRDFHLGHSWELTTARTFSMFALGLTGRLKEVLERYPTLLAEANARGDIYTATSLRVSVGLYVGLARDRPPEARQEVDNAMQQWSKAGFHVQHANALICRGLIDIYCGEQEAAMHRFAAAWPEIRRTQLHRVEVFCGIIYSVYGWSAIHAAADGNRHGLKTARRIVRAIEARKAPWLTGTATSLRGGIAAVQGKTEQARELYGRALEQLEKHGLNLNSVGVKRAYGVLVGGSKGQTLVADADAHYAAQGVANPARFARMYAYWKPASP